MTPALPDAVARYVARHHVMTLATQGPDGPWASAVFYAEHGDALVFLSSPATRHCRNLAADARCSAAIHSDVDDWQLIQGIQLEGRVDELAGDERDRAIVRYAEKFPFVRPAVAAPAIVQALARVRWFRLCIQRLHFIDNRRGFGQRQTFEA